MTDEKKKVLSYIDEKADVIIDTSDKIWDFAELSLREFKSGELYAQVLKEEGFEVEHPFCGGERKAGSLKTLHPLRALSGLPAGLVSV